MTSRENFLRAARFERPQAIPMRFHLNAACWHAYDQEALQDLLESHPLLFPGFVRTDRVQPEYLLNQRKDTPYTDPWGCRWETYEDGITGSVTGHPLADWSTFSGYQPPDPGETDGTYPIDWGRIRSSVIAARERGDLVFGGLPHGHTFLRLQDIRGYENLIYDMMDGEPRLNTLIGMVEEFNAEFVRRWLELEPDVMSFPEDLGMQSGPMISPDAFRKHIKPVYQRLMRPARDQGCMVHMHSDGDVRALVDDLIEGGVEIINLQDLVNGIDWIAGRFGGRICVDLDVDRQFITTRGTPAQVDALVREEVERIGSREGGLMMIYGMYPGVPLENARALMDAMERYAGYYA